MSLSIPISALLLYPLLYLLQPNLVRFRWGFEKGLTPMPPEVQEKAEAADRLVLCVSHVILFVVVVLLMRGSPISEFQVGVTTDNWKSALGMGILLSLLPLGLKEFLLRNPPPEEVRNEIQSRGPVAVWFGLNTLRSFSHEFWRAFCIVALIRSGLSAWVAILIAAAAYGTLHLQISVARALGSAAFGGTAGFLFVNTGSLLAPLTMSLVVGAASLYQLRHANQRIRRRESRFSRPCPVCGAIIRLSETAHSLDMLACPNCGESLTTEKKSLWVIGAVSLVAAGYATRHLVYREPGYLLLTEGLFFAFFVVGAFLLGALYPPKYKRAGGKTFDKALSLFGTEKSDPDKKSARK